MNPVEELIIFDKTNQKMAPSPILTQSFSKRKLINQKIHDKFVEMCLNSTVHGVSNIARTKNIVMKYIWILAFFLFSSFAAILITISIFDFFEYNVNTNIQVINQIPTDFPAISICNLNTFKTSDPNIHRLLNKVLINYNDSAVTNGPPPLVFKSASRILRTYISNMTDENKKKFGIQIEEMLISAFFNGVSVGPRNFTWYYDFEFGNCYMFNGDEANILKSGKNGRKGGLQLELYVGNSSEQEAFVDRRGFRLLIHNQTDVKPYLDEDGIDVSPGFVSNIAIKRTFYSKLAYPFSNCIDDKKNTNPYKTIPKNIIFSKLNIKRYSQRLCQHLVYQWLLHSYCGCLDPSFETKFVKNPKFCNTPTQIICSDYVFSKFYSTTKLTYLDYCPIGIIIF